MSDASNWLIIPPAPPPRFWLDGAPADFRELQEKLDAGEDWTRDEFIYYHRERGKRDLFFLAKYILGYNRLVDSLHQPIAWAWQAPNGWRTPTGVLYDAFRMAELPRGHLKTYLLTVAYTILLIIQDQDRRILIYSSNMTMAQKIFSLVRMYLEGKGINGKLFQACYSDLLPTRTEREKWSDNMLTVKRPTPYSDATLEASGIGANITGSHFTHENVDDIIGREETREQMEKACGMLDALTPLYDSIETGERRFVCTPWAFYDPSVYVERNWPNALVARRCMFERDGRPLTDAREFSQDHLIFRWREDMSRAVEEAKRLKKRNPFFYACQYECNPRDERRIGFKSEWFRSCIRRGDVIVELDQDGRTGREVPLARCHLYILVDPNTGRVPGTRVDANKPITTSTDYVGMIVLAVSPDNIWYVLEVYRERYSPDAFCNKLEELVSYWSPRWVALEQRASQRWIKTVFVERWRRGRPMFHIVDWQGDPISKQERIRGLIPRHADGFIFYRTRAPEDVQDAIDALRGELMDFPNAEHDDASDALSAGLQVCIPPGKETALTRVQAADEFETEMAKLDAGSQWVWRALRQKERGGADGLGLGSEFFH